MAAESTNVPRNTEPRASKQINHTLSELHLNKTRFEKMDTYNRVKGHFLI